MFKNVEDDYEGISRSLSDLAVEPPPPYQACPVALDETGHVRIDPDAKLNDVLHKLLSPSADCVSPTRAAARPSFAFQDRFPLRLKIVIQVVGSRGDVQPFVALGVGLMKHNHRVRLATHERFRSLVEAAGLEFFSIGGDPAQLMSYMVRNPGLIPSMASLKAGEISEKRRMIASMLEGCWDSCIAADPGTGRPFVADAIIANPPSFAHMHCAEALGVPLHMMFTMPWSPTRAFPHPLANFVRQPKDAGLANSVSYLLVEWMTWQGLGHVINNFRRKLDLEPISRSMGPSLAHALRVPHTYCWSQALVPKPADWPAQIDVCGFFFRPSIRYSPSETLQKFLSTGTMPIYIGFGSIVLDNTAAVLSAVLEAVTNLGKRAIIAPGWSGMKDPRHRDVFWLEDDCPHEWLFQHVSTVVHHGGAGTTACGLRNAKPTVIIPFFGDQAFWGARVAAAGVGPEPVPHKRLTASKLSAAIRFCDSDLVRRAAEETRAQIEREDGVEAAIRSFHANLPLERLRCAILPDQVACWTTMVAGSEVKISMLAAKYLEKYAILRTRNLKLHHSDPKIIPSQRWDPVTGTASSLIETATGLVDATAGIFIKPYQLYAHQKCPRPQSNQAPMPPDQEDDASQSHNAMVLNRHTAASMALASSTSIRSFFTTYANGMLVEMPLAASEGFLALPRLWGGEVKSYGEVRDWKDGIIVAARTFTGAIGTGFEDIARLPAAGCQEEGAWGAAKGVMKGSGNLISRTAGASLGLVAFPGKGIAKTLYGWTHTRTARVVAEARRAQALCDTQEYDSVAEAKVLSWYQSINTRVQ